MRRVFNSEIRNKRLHIEFDTNSVISFCVSLPEFDFFVGGAQAKHTSNLSVGGDLIVEIDVLNVILIIPNLIQ